jgi:hypothetical protein
VTVSAEVVALIAAGVAVFAAVLAVRATALIARTVLVDQARRQGEEEAPGRDLLTVNLVEGHTRRDLASDTRDYVFVVKLANRSGSERRLHGVTLRVTYRTRANFLGAVDLASDAATSVAPGQTTSTTLRFTTSNVIPRHCRVDSYTLSFVDDHGQRLRLDASLPDVLEADTDGTGPVTWGWD